MKTPKGPACNGCGEKKGRRFVDDMHPKSWTFN